METPFHHDSRSKDAVQVPLLLSFTNKENGREMAQLSRSREIRQIVLRGYAVKHNVQVCSVNGAPFSAVPPEVSPRSIS